MNSFYLAILGEESVCREIMRLTAVILRSITVMEGCGNKISKITAEIRLEKQVHPDISHIYSIYISLTRTPTILKIMIMIE